MHRALRRGKLRRMWVYKNAHEAKGQENECASEVNGQGYTRADKAAHYNINPARQTEHRTSLVGKQAYLPRSGRSEPG